MSEPTGIDNLFDEAMSRTDKVLEKAIAEEKQASPPQEPVNEPEPVVDPPKAEETKPTEPEKKEPEATAPPKAESGPEKKPDPEDAAPEDEDENPHFKKVADKPEGDDSDKGIRKWAEMKAHVKELETKLKEKEGGIATDAAKEIETYRNQVSDIQAKLEAEQSKRVEIERELKAASIERSPEYVREITAPTKSMRGTVDVIASRHDVNPEKLWQAIQEHDFSKRTDLIEELTDGFKSVERAEIVEISREWNKVASRKDEFEKGAEQIIESERAKAEADRQAFLEREREEQKLFANKTWGDLQERHDFLRPVNGNDKWNDRLRREKQLSHEANLDQLSTEERAAILSRASAFPFMESAALHYRKQADQIAQEKDAQIAELESKINSLRGVQPDLGNADSTQSSDSKEDAKKYSTAEGFAGMLLGT